MRRIIELDGFDLQRLFGGEEVECSFQDGTDIIVKATPNAIKNFQSTAMSEAKRQLLEDIEERFNQFQEANRGGHSFLEKKLNIPEVSPNDTCNGGVCDIILPGSGE